MDGTQFLAALGVLGSLASLVSVYFAIKAVRDARAVTEDLRELKENLQAYVVEFNAIFDSITNIMGLRAYLREAVRLYDGAQERIVSVARVWLVSNDLERVLDRIKGAGGMKVTFCGPVGLNEQFPHLLWRLHYLYVKLKIAPQRVCVLALADLPIRYTVADSQVLIAGAPPPTKPPEEMVGWTISDQPSAAEFYNLMFEEQLRPRCGEAEDLLISEMTRMFSGPTSIQVVLNHLVREVLERQYEVYHDRSAWGRPILKAEFERVLIEWLDSLADRHPTRVTYDNGTIAFR